MFLAAMPGEEIHERKNIVRTLMQLQQEGRFVLMPHQRDTFIAEITDV